MIMSMEVFNKHYYVAPLSRADYDKIMQGFWNERQQFIRKEKYMHKQLTHTKQVHESQILHMQKQHQSELKEIQRRLERMEQAFARGSRAQMASSPRAQRALEPMFSYASIMQPSAPRTQPKHEIDSDTSKSDEGHEITEEEHDNTCAKKRKVTCKPRQASFSMNTNEVHIALSTIKPILDVSKFRFVDHSAHKEFFVLWGSDGVFENSTSRVSVSPQQREKCGSKMLGCCGYTTKGGDGISYEWIGHRALINGYRNCGTNYQLDAPTKTIVRTLARYFPMHHVLDNSLEFREVTKDTAAREIAQLCPLHGRMEGRKDLEFVLMCKLLRSFHAQGKIVDLHRLQRST